MQSEFETLLEENLDILKEIGNIGMGHASTSLSQMLSMKVAMTVPNVYAMDIDEAISYLSSHKAGNHGVVLNLQGDSKGIILQVLSMEFATKVINIFFQSEYELLENLDEMSLSVLQEIGNITSGAYCNSLASMTGCFLDISTPTHCPDFEHELEKFRGGELNMSKLIIIENSFFIDNEEVKSNFLFIPDEKTILMILEKLKEYYGLTT